MELENTLQLPDLWQQEALRALQEGLDVVVDAPTGAGKTFIFEMLAEKGIKGQMVYTVPTRALANDKLYEWRAKGWQVGITTGDISDKPEAPILVATLETQRGGILAGHGPRLLIIDEYQMLGDTGRGTSYELAMALAPSQTQLLMLSGSTRNPEEIVEWMKRMGRNATLVRKKERPVPLEEVFFEALRFRPPRRIRNHWSKQIYKALEADLGPILIFAPKRLAAEQLARQLANDLEPEIPLFLSEAQKNLAGSELKRLLRSRVCYHHSGLSYAQRAGVIEPLAKTGQIQVIVATTGLGSGINFSMRSVFLMDNEYRADEEHRHLRPDELLQMFGRAGRRGLDEKGFVLVEPGKPRLNEAKALKLKRHNQVDWPSLLALMRNAVRQGKDPIEATQRLTGRLFSEQRIPLGLRDFVSNPPETSQFPKTQSKGPINKGREIIEILNSEGIWERRKVKAKAPLAQAKVFKDQKWHSALHLPESLSAVKVGSLCRLRNTTLKTYGRELPLARFPEEEGQEKLLLLKSIQQRIRKYLNESKSRCKRRTPPKFLSLEQIEKRILPLLPRITQGGRASELYENRGTISVRLDYSEAQVFGWQDSKGKILLNPPTRRSTQEIPDAYRDFLPGKNVTNAPNMETPADAWYHLGLIDKKAHPTRRGVLFSFFQQGEGLAVAAALEDPAYPVEDLVWHLANLRAGHRFERHVNSSTRLGIVCREAYHRATSPGYLRQGLPIHYGEGAAEVLQAIEGQPFKARDFIDEDLRPGDIERATIEWRSLLRQIAFGPDYEWDRWRHLKKAARSHTNQYRKELLLDNLPPLTPEQRIRYQPFKEQ